MAALGKGTRVRITNHAGCGGRSGTIANAKPERIRGHLYWTVRLGRDRMRFLRSELQVTGN